MRRSSPIIVLAIVVGFYLAACTPVDAEPPMDRTRVAKLTEVVSATEGETLSMPATIRSNQWTELAFELSGRLVEMNVLEGQWVSKGDVIARLDARAAKADLLTAQAEYENARAQLRRSTALLETNAISRSDVDTQTAREKTTLAQLQHARKAVSDTELVAPFDGRVAQVFVRQYQNINAQELVVSLQGAALEARTAVPGSLIARYPALERQAIVVRMDDLPDLEIPASFREIAGEADPQTRTFDLSVTFDAPDSVRILPGMTATLSVALPSSGAVEATRRVPIGALLSVGDDTAVWVVDPETMQLRQQVVVIDSVLGDQVSLTDGPEVGETIVAAAASFFQEGVVVRPWSEGP